MIQIMAANDKIIRKSVPLASADFDSIKNSLKEFLKQRPELADYDFDGSVLSVLLDELSLNSHINAFYLNMVGNEAFLKSAVRRDSVVSRAEAIGYVPRSISSSIAKLYIELIPSNITPPSFIDVPKYTQFSTSASGLTFIFQSVDDVRITADSNGKFVIDDVEVVEGKFLTHRFVVDDNIIKHGVIIPNINVDSLRIEVVIAENTTTSNFVTHKKSSDIAILNSDSEVYFIRESEGFINVYFGDGVIGKAPVTGSVVRVTYPVSSGPAANGAVVFSLLSSISGVDSAVTIPSDPSFGGADAESIESIKLNAPRFFETQNRAVTKFDYEAIVRNKYSNIDDVVVWGGEDNVPPVYGKVFIAIKPESGYYMSITEKSAVVSIVKKYNVLSITPIVVDPDYIFVKIVAVVDFSDSLSDVTPGEIQTIVSNRIFAYSDSSISRFDKTLRKSVLSRIIDNSDPSIISNTFGMTLEKRFFPITNEVRQIQQSFSNPIVPGSVTSSEFIFNGATNCFYHSYGEVLGIYRNVGASVFTIIKNAGVVNNETGEIITNPIEIDGISNSITQKDELTGAYFMSFNATPAHENVATNNRQIVQIIKCTVTARKINEFDI